MDVFNPVLRGVHEMSTNITIEETSDMCHTPLARNIVRSTRVKAQWMDSNWKPRQEVLSGVEAICLQHFIDLFNGQWPCSSVGEDARRVPKL